MKLFSFLFKNSKRKRTLDSVLNDIKNLKCITPDNIQTFNELHKELSKFFYKIVVKKDISTLVKIIESSLVSVKDLLDENGYNIIEYSLFFMKNDLFKFLYKNCHKKVRVCFKDIPALFIIVLNKNNFDLIEFFIKDEFLSLNLKKENIMPCFFLLIQSGKMELCDFLINHFYKYFDNRNLEANIIYLISHNQQDKLKNLLSHDKLFENTTSCMVEKIMTFSIMYNNLDAIKTFLDNKYIINVLEDDVNITKSILQLAYKCRDEYIVNKIITNNKLKSNIGSVLKIDK